MPRAEFRFYEELNDFLPSQLRKRAFETRFGEGATVKHAIEALGIPHTEVDLILVGGESVEFSYKMRPRDRVSVYPRFEAFDITPVFRLHARPLRDPRFLTDAHLGGLAKYLRILGFDTLTRGDRSIEELVDTARAERRVILTRSRALLMRSAVTHGCFVHAERPRSQCEEILDRLQLHTLSRPLRRCVRCNAVLEDVEKAAVASRLDRATRELFERFRRCPDCDRVYWRGSHYRRMSALAERLLGAPPRPGPARPGKAHEPGV